MTAAQDKVIAKTLFEFRELGKQVTKALRADDVALFQGLMAEGASFTGPRQARDLWRVVRRSLPKTKAKRAQQQPLKIVALEDQWIPHLCTLETGRVVTPDEFLDYDKHLSIPTVPSCHQDDLPSLQRLESSFRATAPHKATGMDPVPSHVFHDCAPVLAKRFFSLLIKEYLWGEEPVQWKGGNMIMLYKKGDTIKVNNYRGIMLLASASKRLHALMRQDLEALLQPIKPQGQIGGFRGQQTAFGAHALRTYAHATRARGLSSAVLFVDLQNAFHRLPRELALSTYDDSDWAAVLQALQEAGNPMQAHATGQRIVGILEKANCPPLLLRLLQNVHHNTWFTLTGQKYVRTARGTRPGSPLADIIYHALMHDAMWDIDNWVKAQPDYSALQAELGLSFTSITWADDVAIPWCAQTPDQLVPAVQSLMAKVYEAFFTRGMPLNMEKGKTSAVLTFRGPQAVAHRQQFQLQDRPGTDVLLRNGENVFLHFMPHYKHLGSQYTAAQNLDFEIKQRAGCAKSAFQLISKPVLTSKHLPERLRTQLFLSLIGTKLFYGLGSWTTPTQKQLQFLSKTYIGLLRRVLRLKPDDKNISNHHVLVRARLPDVRTRLAVERLLYAQKLYRLSPVFLQEALRVEHECLDDSWLAGLHADLEWMKAVDDSSVPAPAPHDLSGLFERWQDGPKA